MLDAALEALLMVLDPARLLFMFLGIFVGLTIGLLPGLSGTVGMSILLPFIYGMDPYTGMAMLIGMVAVVHTGDTFPSILMGVPGTSGSQATIMDGHPLAKQGKASQALGVAFFCSMVGGIIGGIALYSAIPMMRPLILSFGSPELFMLSLFGLSMVGILSGKSPLKGFLSGILGLMLGAVGSAPAVAVYRYTFDSIYLSDGIPLAVVALGLFAIPAMIDLLTSNQSISKSGRLKGNAFQGIQEALKNKWLMFRSSVVGAIVGFIPGLGGSVVDWISYGIAQRTVKNNNFGQGDIRGVIAPESANNAKEGGALIPTLMFGIPGSGTTAILLGGLTLMGLQAGPRMVTDNLPITLSIIWTLIIANIFGAFMCILLAKPIAKLSTIPGKSLVPFLLVILVVGAYQSSRSWGDLIVFIAIGVLGWVMAVLDWPRAPLLIGFVLSNSAERYLWISISRYELSWLTNPFVIGIGIVILLLLSSGFLLKRFSSRVDNIKEKMTT